MSDVPSRLLRISGKFTVGLVLLGTLISLTRVYLFKYYRTWRVRKLLRFRRLSGSIPNLQTPSEMLVLSAIEDTSNLRCCGLQADSTAADNVNYPYKQCSDEFQKFKFWSPVFIRFPTAGQSGNAYGSILFRPLLQRWSSKGEDIKPPRQGKMPVANMSDEGISGEHQEFELQIGAFMDEFFESKAGEEMSTTEGEINKSTARRFQLWQRNLVAIRQAKGKWGPLLTTVAQIKKQNPTGTQRRRSRSTAPLRKKIDENKPKRTRSFARKPPDLDDLAAEQPMTQGDN